MATTTPVKPKSEKSPLDIIKDAQEIIKSQTDALIADLQRKLQATADTVNTIKGITGKNILSDPAFEQAISELGLTQKGSATTTKKAKTELAPIKDTPLALEICGVIKKHDKPIDVAAVATAVGTKVKKTTIANYMARLVAENVLYRPSRGQFAIK